MKNVLDLFSGIGGFALGAKRAGLNVVASYELSKRACADYERVTELPATQADLFAVDIATLPDTDGIIAGPPCQPFSIAGKRRGSKDERDGFKVLLDIIAVKKPFWALIENVPGLLSTKYFAGVIERLKALEYTVAWRLLNAADYGVPQTRNRVFIAIVREGKWAWAEPTHCKRANLFGLPQWVTWADALAPMLHHETPLPKWVTSRFERVPANALFSRNFEGGTAKPRWRAAHLPCYTITAHDGGHSFPIVYQGKPYRANAAMCAALQTLPTTLNLTHEGVGNAVPPTLAQALLAAGVQ